MSKKGTIIYLGGFELPDKNAAAHRVLSNGKIFRDLGYKVIFIGVDKSTTIKNFNNTKKVVQGFETWTRIYPQGFKEWFNYLNNMDFMKYILSNYSDIKAVVAYNYPAISLVKLKKICHKKNIKIIGDCTEWYSMGTTKGIYKVIKVMDTSIRMRFIHKKLDGLIVISKYLENYYSMCKNIIRLPPLVDLNEEKWNINVSSDLSKENIIKLIYSGNMGPDKDKINILIDSLYKINNSYNYYFNIIGITKENYLDIYPEQKEKLKKLENRINFMGRISHLESIKEIKSSDFSIFIRENTRLANAGFPTKFVESISNGVPVITNNTSDLEEYLGNNEFGFLLSNIEMFPIEISRILSLTNDEIYYLKEKCEKNNPFNYSDYLSTVEKFINKIFNKTEGED